MHETFLFEPKKRTIRQKTVKVSVRGSMIGTHSFPFQKRKRYQESVSGLNKTMCVSKDDLLYLCLSRFLGIEESIQVRSLGRKITGIRTIVYRKLFTNLRD